MQSTEYRVQRQTSLQQLVWRESRGEYRTCTLGHWQHLRLAIQFQALNVTQLALLQRQEGAMVRVGRMLVGLGGRVALQEMGVRS